MLRHPGEGGSCAGVETARGLLDQLPGTVVSAGHAVHERQMNTDAGVAFDDFERQQIAELGECRQAAGAADELRRGAADEPFGGGGGGVAGGQQVADGAFAVAVLVEPPCRPTVQLAHGGRVGTVGKAAREHVAEQVVQPHPVPGQRNDELVAALQLGQQLRAAAALQHRVAQRRRQRVEDR